MTVAMLLVNTVAAAERRLRSVGRDRARGPARADRPFARRLRRDRRGRAAALGRSGGPSAGQARDLVGYVDAVNVTDNPTATAHMSPLAGVAARRARPASSRSSSSPVRDRNRLALTADLLGAWALGARNLLCLSGDPIAIGDHPDAARVDGPRRARPRARWRRDCATEGRLLVRRRDRRSAAVPDRGGRRPLAPSPTTRRGSRRSWTPGPTS